MHDGLGTGALQGVGHGGGVGDVPPDEPAIGDGLGVPFDEVVVGEGLVSRLEQATQARAADVAGPAGDEDPHDSRDSSSWG